MLSRYLSRCWSLVLTRYNSPSRGYNLAQSTHCPHSFATFTEENTAVDHSISGVHVHEQKTTASCNSANTRPTEHQHTDGGDEVHHVPVLSEEVVDIIKPQDGQVVVDMTFGAGGHTKTLLAAAPRIKVFALDRDPVAYGKAQKLAVTRPEILPMLGKFSQVGQFLEQHSIVGGCVDAILFDVGASSMQFDDTQRGFSLSRDGPLDMRMDGGRSPDQLSAADVVNYMDENSLFRIIKKYGEERRARQIARAIIDCRYTFGHINRTSELATIVSGVFESGYSRDKLNRHAHVATKTFQALRIFVNNELNELYNGLEIAHHLLKPGGVCVAIAFHSLEDRIIKRHFHGIDMDARLNMSVVDHHRNSAKVFNEEYVGRLLDKKWEPISKKVLLPTDEEIARNPRARSAKLRAAYKI